MLIAPDQIRLSAVWAWLGWWVPVVSLWFPKLIVDDSWRITSSVAAAGPRRRYRDTTLWWVPSSILAANNTRGQLLVREGVHRGQTASSPAREGQVLQCESTAGGCGEECDQTDHEDRLGSGRGMDSRSGELSNRASNPPLSSGAPDLSYLKPRSESEPFTVMALPDHPVPVSQRRVDARCRAPAGRSGHRTRCRPDRGGCERRSSRRCF